MDEGIGLALALTLPAAAALGVAPGFLIEGFFTRGAFLTSDANNAGLALMHYAWGVPAFVLIKVLAPAYFAHEDTKTPMAFALWSVVINTVLGAGLFFWLQSNGAYGFPGLAIATSVAAWVNVIFLFSGLIKRGWYTPGPRLVSRLVRAVLATMMMAVVLVAVLHYRTLIETHIYDSKLVVTMIFILFGMMTYAISAIITGAVRISDLKGLVRRRAVE